MSYFKHIEVLERFDFPAAYSKICLFKLILSTDVGAKEGFEMIGAAFNSGSGMHPYAKVPVNMKLIKQGVL